MMMMIPNSKWTSTPSRTGSWARRIYILGEWRIEPISKRTGKIVFGRPGHVRYWRVSYRDESRARCGVLKDAKDFVESQVT